MVRIGASVGRGICIAVQINVAPNAFRAAASTPQYVNSVEPNLLWASCL